MSEKLMRVLIDGRKIGPNGIGVYTENLIAAAVAMRNIELGVLFSAALQSENDLAKYSWSSKIEKVWYQAGLYSLKEYLLLGRIINSGNWDIFHSPHYTLPYGIKCKKIVTIHDLIHLTHPESWYYPYFAKFLIASALKRADQILTVSQGSRADLLKFFPGMDQKIEVIPNIVDSTFLDIEAVPLPKDKYFMAVISTWKPHKGVRLLVDVFKKFSQDSSANERQGYKLILVGSGIAKGLKLGEAQELIRGDEARIELQGRVSKEELKELYKNATALCVASTTEGFCLPMIEAHANLCPVICRPVPALKELIIDGFDLQASDWSFEAYLKLFFSFFENAVARNQSQVSFAKSINLQLDRFSAKTVGAQVEQVYRKVFESSL